MAWVGMDFLNDTLPGTDSPAVNIGKVHIVGMAIFHLLLLSKFSTSRLRSYSGGTWTFRPLRLIQLVVFSVLGASLAFTLPTTSYTEITVDSRSCSITGPSMHSPTLDPTNLFPSNIYLRDNTLILQILLCSELDSQLQISFIRVAWYFYAVVYLLSLAWGLLYLTNRSVVAAPLALLKVAIS